MNKNNNTPNILYAALYVMNIHEAVLGVMFRCSHAPCSPPNRLARAHAWLKSGGVRSAEEARARTPVVICHRQHVRRLGQRQINILLKKRCFKGLVGVL